MLKIVFGGAVCSVLRWAAVCLPLLGANTGASAQTYPDRPVRIVMPGAPGSGADILSRVTAEGLSSRWNQRVYVENKPGASGILGAQEVLASPADGHTLLFGIVTYITTLFRHSAPQIRFNINDISSYMTGADCPCGCSFRRLAKIYGRYDNMVKVRGVNVFTEAIGVTVAENRHTNGEFFCVVERFGESGREELTVMVEVPELAAHGAAVKNDLGRRLKEVIGLRTIVSPVGVRALDPHTGLSQTSKVKRLLDKREAT